MIGCRAVRVLHGMLAAVETPASNWLAGCHSQPALDHELELQLLADHELADQLLADHELALQLLADHELALQLLADHELAVHSLPFHVPPDQLEPDAANAAIDLLSNT